MGSYREWRRGYRVRTGDGFVRGYPWSMVLLGLTMGVVIGASFRNVFAALAALAATVVFGLWYWRPGGRGRQMIERMSNDPPSE